MRRILFFLACTIFSIGVFAQGKFYDLSFTASSGKVISLADYKGKKLMIVAVGTKALQDKRAARYLGEIQSSYPDVSVLILPIKDKQDSLTNVDLKVLRQMDKTEYGATIDNKADSGFVQHPLIMWLTQSTLNRHFDKAITPDEQYFMINEAGVLYAVLDRTVSDSFLKVVLSAKEVRYLGDASGSNKIEVSNP